MLLSTTNEIQGKKIVQTLGVVKGNTIRARHIGRDIVAGLRSIVGGEIKDYTVMLEDSREEALERMIADAKKLKADGIVGIRFTTSAIMSGASELLAYGTAVKLK